MWEIWVQSLGWEDPLEEGMATQYSGLENPHGQKSLASYSPRDSQESSHMELNTHLWIPEMLDSTVSSRKPKVKVKVAQSCPTLCDPTDYTVHGILQATILEWVAFLFSRGSSQPRD